MTSAPAKSPPTAARGMAALPPGLRELLRCPACRAELSGPGPDFSCPACGRDFAATPDGRPDLRLRDPVRIGLSLTLGEPLDIPEHLDFAPLAFSSEPQVDFAGLPVPRHLSPEILSWFPKAGAAGEIALDLGSGRGLHRAAVERAGFAWAGLDYATKRAPLLADAHALPFADASFGFILSVAVLEHLRHPYAALAEIGRVLRPGGRLIATMAFLEPFHKNSFFNISHLGALSLLHHAGLFPRAVAPGQGGRFALSRMGLVAGVARGLGHGIVTPVHWLHRIWWKIGRRWHPRLTEPARRLILSGDMTVIADRPA